MGAPRGGHYGGDPQRLFVMGHSAGAYNAAMIALDGRWLAEQGMTPSALRGWIGRPGRMISCRSKIRPPNRCSLSCYAA
jgi:hypothetical protein